MKVQVCQHLTMLANTCGDCGVTLDPENVTDRQTLASYESVSMVHTMPGLRVHVDVSGFEFFMAQPHFFTL